MQPRQMYGLGSLVKKAVKGVKNVIKSPIGKAAMLGAVGFGIPGTSIGGLFGRAGFGGAAKGLLGNFGLAQTLGMTGMSPGAMGGKSPGILNALQRGFGGMSTAAKTFLGGGAALTLSAMFPQEEGENNNEYLDRLKRLEPLMDRYYKNVNPNASADEVKDFILKNTQEYRAMGGRVGYRFGGDTMEKEGIKSLEAGAPDVTYSGDMRLASESGPEEFEMDLMSELIQAFEEAKKQGFQGDFKSFLDMYMGDSARTPQGIMQEAPTQMMADGGRIGFSEGDLSKDQVYQKWVERYENDPDSPLVTMHENFNKYKNFYEQNKKAQGGRVGLSSGANEIFEAKIKELTDKGLSRELAEVIVQSELSQEAYTIPDKKAQGGRVGFFTGGSKIKELGLDEDYIREIRIQWLEAGKPMSFSNFLRNDLERQAELSDEMKAQMANGGMPLEEDDEEDSYRAGVLQAMDRRKVMGGGMMELPTGIIRMNQGGIMERDYRDEGGFVPVGIKEKADDVPAMLSKNEFVMTADAVRGAGGGSVQKGAQKMYDTMKSLERKVV
jgi:hypothetical protein